MRASCKPERQEELADIATYLLEYFPQYGRGAHYLQQLAGKVAISRKTPNRLTYILSGPAPARQQGHAALVDPEPQNVRKLKVKFHRYY